jgi:hypothetical protein
LHELLPARIGSVWAAAVDLSGAAAGARSALIVSQNAVAPMRTASGEILVDVTARAIPDDLGFGTHVLPVPADLTLVGLTFHAQGAVLSGAGARLTNALAVTAGF